MFKLLHYLKKEPFFIILPQYKADSQLKFLLLCLKQDYILPLKKLITFRNLSTDTWVIYCLIKIKR